MAKGIVYICSTAIPGLIKIGKTRTDEYENRMKTLEDNGYRNCTGLKREFAIEVEDFDNVEFILHRTFYAHRVGNTELFACNLDNIVKVLSSFNGRIVYPVDETKEEIVNKAEDGAASSELPDGYYFFKPAHKDYEGKMLVENGILTLLAGSKLGKMTEVAKNASPNWVLKRHELGSEACVLSKDIICSSVSEAAYYVCGHGMNGWVAWKDKEGDSIQIYRKK